MIVKLLCYSKATPAFEAEGLENLQDLIAFCAKVSNPTAQINHETSERLIKYLIKHQHWSPLEMVNATLEIETTRDIAHQIVRHRPAEQGDIFEYSEARLQDPQNRQNSISTDDNNLQMWWDAQQKHIAEVAKVIYENAIAKGIAKEQARKILPEGLTKTRLYMQGSIRSWVHYIELRGANGTQKEHMEIAHACAKVIAEIFPLAASLES